MRTAWFWSLLVAAACGHPLPRPPGDAAGTTAFVDVTVVPMDHEGVLAHHSVVTRGGKIVAVGPMATVTVPAGARVVQGAGKFLVPGLADMHVHTYDQQELALFVTRGVTTVRIMWGDATVIGIRDAIRSGQPRLAPSIWTAGPIIDGDPPIWPGSSAVTTAQQATDEIAWQARAGFDFIKVYSKLSPEAYAAIVANAKVPVAGHVPLAVKLGGVLDVKQASIEHLDGYAGYAERDDSPLKSTTDFMARVAVFKYTDPAKLTDAVARTKAAGTWSCPTLVVRDRIAHLDHPDASLPELAFVAKGSLEQWDPKRDFRFAKWTQQQFDDARAGMAWNFALVKQLSDAGAGLLAGTDVGNPWLVPGYSLHDELALLVAAKLTPYQALRAATAAPAEFLRDAAGGAVAVGKRADLMLLDGDPLADIANTKRIAGVMLRGRWMPESELSGERDRIAAIYRGERSRFESAPPLPTTATFRARYSGVGEVVGEERITLDGDHLIAEQRGQFTPESRWDLELGPSGRGARMHVTSEGLDLMMTREGKKARVAGAYGHDTVAVEEDIADDEVFGGSPLGIDAATYRTLSALPAGETATVKLLVLGMRPRISLHHLTLPIKRLPDATRTFAGKPVPVHVYQLVMFGVEVALDHDGWIVSTSTHQRVE